MTLSVPKRDGFRFSWPSFTLMEGETPLEGIRGFNIKPVVEGRSETYGRGRFPNGFTKGTVRFEGQLVWQLDFWNDWTKAKGEGFLDGIYSFTGRYEEGVDRRTILIGGVVFTEADSPAAQGDEGLSVTVPFKCLEYLENGISPFQAVVR